MPYSSPIYCFRANYEKSNFDQDNAPDWLNVEVNWQGYRISTLPWIADVAIILGVLSIENTTSGWISYLETLGLKEITLICCEDLFEDKLYC